MISRLWHGYTTWENQTAYEQLLLNEIFPGIAQKNVEGYRGVQLWKRELPSEVEFTTIMWFESMEAVMQFAGEDYEVAVVPPKARELLRRFDARSVHCEVVQDLRYDK